MKVLSLIEKIARTDSGFKRRSAEDFLYGTAAVELEERNIAPTTESFIQRLRLEGDDYTELGININKIIIGNDDLVLKLGTNEFNFEKSGSLSTDTIPNSLAAQVIERGNHNGVGYIVCEALNTKEHVTLE